METIDIYMEKKMESKLKKKTINIIKSDNTNSNKEEKIKDDSNKYLEEKNIKRNQIKKKEESKYSINFFINIAFLVLLICIYFYSIVIMKIISKIII